MDDQFFMGSLLGHIDEEEAEYGCKSHDGNEPSIIFAHENLLY